MFVTDELVETRSTDSNIKGFVRHLLVHDRLRRTTIDNYRKVASKVLRDLAAAHPSHAEIEDYVEALRISKRRYSAAHISSVCLSIERYMKFIGDPIRLGRPRKEQRVIKNILSEAEVAVFIAATKNPREKAIISVLAYSGMRARELCNLRVYDVDIAHNSITIRDGKGKKDRVVCISGECAKTVLAYLAAYPRLDDAYLFTTLRRGSQYTTWALRQLIKTVLKRTDITKPAHPHLFRHSFATHLLKRGASILTVKDQLGHVDIKTTMIYVWSSFDRIQAEYNQFQPAYQ